MVKVSYLGSILEILAPGAVCMRTRIMNKKRTFWIFCRSKCLITMHCKYDHCYYYDVLYLNVNDVYINKYINKNIHMYKIYKNICMIHLRFRLNYSFIVIRRFGDIAYLWHFWSVIFYFYLGRYLFKMYHFMNTISLRYILFTFVPFSCTHDEYDPC